MCGGFKMAEWVYHCHCGYYQDAVKECTCPRSVIKCYQKRISSPMLDRIHIHVELLRVDYDKLVMSALGNHRLIYRCRGGGTVNPSLTNVIL
jgi:magnesium chelatase family protein